MERRERNSRDMREQERISERTQIVEVPMPQVLEETVEAVRVVQRERIQQQTVLHERVQQRTAEQIEDAPQSPEETVEAVRSVSHERVQQRATGKIGEVPETASQDCRLQRSVDVKSIPPNTEISLQYGYDENDNNNMSNETKRETNYSMNNK